MDHGCVCTDKLAFIGEGVLIWDPDCYTSLARIMLLFNASNGRARRGQIVELIISLRAATHQFLVNLVCGAFCDDIMISVVVEVQVSAKFGGRFACLALFLSP